MAAVAMAMDTALLTNLDEGNVFTCRAPRLLDPIALSTLRPKPGQIASPVDVEIHPTAPSQG
jgi:hypothetical protein